VDAREAEECASKILAERQEQKEIAERARIQREKYEAEVAPKRNLEIAKRNITEATERGLFRAESDIGYQSTIRTLEDQGYRLYHDPVVFRDGSKAPYHHWIYWGQVTNDEVEFIKIIKLRHEEKERLNPSAGYAHEIVATWLVVITIWGGIIYALF